MWKINQTQIIYVPVIAKAQQELEMNYRKGTQHSEWMKGCFLFLVLKQTLRPVSK